MTLRSGLFGLVLLVASVVQATAASLSTQLTNTYSSFWVFGDSLSDPGNLFAATGGTAPPSPPYYQGRFSNGPVWAESITGSFLNAGKAAGNFAFGGATAVTNADSIPDFQTQALLYGANAAPVAGPKPLASVFFGANDLLDAFAANIGNPNAAANIAQAAVAAADAVGAGIMALAKTGIADFAVWNLPDLGLTPRFALLFPSGSSQAGSAATAIFNSRLDQVLAGLSGQGLSITKIDTFGLFAQVRANPGAFGLTDTTLPCLFPDAASAALFSQPQLCSAASADTKLFFDTIHPSATAHQALAANFVATVAPVPLPATGLMLVAALGALALRRRVVLR
jgi:outer membrane lipase/esterase